MTKNEIIATLNNCNSVEAVKAAFAELFPKVRAGKQTDFLYAEYEKAYIKAGDRHVTMTGKVYRQHTDLTARDYASLVAATDQLDGITLSVSGQKLIASGNTKAHKADLKALGYWWNFKAKVWEWYTMSADKLAVSLPQMRQYCNALAE